MSCRLQGNRVEIKEMSVKVLSGFRCSEWRLWWVWPMWRWAVPKVSLNSAQLFKGFLVLCGRSPAGQEAHSSAFTFQTLFWKSCRLDIFRHHDLLLQCRSFIRLLTPMWLTGRDVRGDEDGHSVLKAVLMLRPDGPLSQLVHQWEMSHYLSYSFSCCFGALMILWCSCQCSVSTGGLCDWCLTGSRRPVLWTLAINHIKFQGVKVASLMEVFPNFRFLFLLWDTVAFPNEAFMLFSYAAFLLSYFGLFD